MIAADGYSYEKEAILKWFALGRKTSPVTNMALDCTEVFPNRAMKAAMDDFLTSERCRLRDALLDTLTQVETNAPDPGDPVNVALLESAAFVESPPSLCHDDHGGGVNTLCILHAILQQWSQDVDVCRASMEALVVIVEGHDDDSHQQLDFLSPVMDLMRRFEQKAAMQAIGLKYIALYSRADGFLKAASIQKLRVCDVVTGAMKQHSLDKQVQVHGFRAVEMLGMNFPSTIFKSGVSKVLMAGACNFTDDAEVMVALTQSMQYLTTGTCSRLCHSGMCKKLADAMELFPRDAHLQRSCCLVVGKLSHSNPTGDESVCDAVITCLQESLVDGADVADAACVAMARLAYWKRYAARIGASGGTHLVVACMVGALNRQQTDMVANAVHALHMLTAAEDREENNNRQVLATKETGKCLVEVLQRYLMNPKMVLSCMKTLRSVCDSHADFAGWCRDEWETPSAVIAAMREHLGEEDIQETGWSFLDKLALHSWSCTRLVMDALVLATSNALQN